LLNNGLEIPPVGLGTGLIKYTEAENLSLVLKELLRYPFPLIDTAGVYQKGEEIVGKILKNLPNKNVFLITKLANCDQKKGMIKKAFEESLKKLNRDYIDLYLLHWPQSGTFIDAYLELEELYYQKKVGAIGVCNFKEHHLEKLLSVATIIPAVNEIERHPLLNQKDLISFCKSLGILPVAYSPLAKMDKKISNSEIFKDLEKKYNKSISQIIFRWNYQNAVTTIGHTNSINRVQEYQEIFDFELTEEQLGLIDSLNENIRFWPDSDNCDFSKL